MAYRLHYAIIIKHSNLNLIDRLQFPWLTASVGFGKRLSIFISALCLYGAVQQSIFRHFCRRLRLHLRSAGLDRRRFGLARPQIVETKSALALASPLRRHHLAGHVSRSFRHLPSRISLAVSSSGHLFLLLPFSLETCQISGTYRLRTIT